MSGINWKKYNESLKEVRSFKPYEKLGKYSYDMKGLANYISTNNKKYSDLSNEELSKFNVRV